jgi:hypothetical protein
MDWHLQVNLVNLGVTLDDFSLTGLAVAELDVAGETNSPKLCSSFENG